MSKTKRTYIYIEEETNHCSEEWRCTSYYKDKKMTKLHREDGPAIFQERLSPPDGWREYKQWCVDGECHREDGPAEIEYYADGSVKEYYWLNDEIFNTKKEYLAELKSRKAPKAPCTDRVVTIDGVKYKLTPA